MRIDLVDETELDSNNSQDEKIVRLSVSGGKATFPGRANKVEKFSSFVEFKFKNVIGNFKNCTPPKTLGHWADHTLDL